MVLSLILSCFLSNAQNFDWDGYSEWKNTTDYSKTYVVAQKHPRASDDNPGSAELPLKTINEAAQRVKPGERVLIYAGVYRETVFPKRGGASESKMVAYEAAPGEKVIVSGSKIYTGQFKQRMIFTDVLTDPDLSYTWSRKTWVTTIPDSFFEEGYFPFRLPNILPAEHKLMPWASLVKEIPPYTSKRALLFQNGRRMTQVEAYGDLTRIPGSFWIDTDGSSLHIHGFDGKDPNLSVIEIGVRPHLFIPQKVGLNYIQLSGITFQHCANGFLRTSTGAITALGGHHWIIENNTIRQINSSGLEFGYLAFEPEDSNPMNKARKRENAIGFHLIRNNHIHDCGTAGIRSFVVPDAVIRGNHIHHCGWQDAENYWECSGIKLLVAHRTLVADNHIHDIQGGNAIWLDWDIQFSRATRNIIYNVQNIQGGIFVEASREPNLVDNNFIWNIDGNGIYANDTNYLLVYHNLIGKITGNVVHAIVQTDRYLNGRKLTAERNSIKNNIFIDGRPMRFSSSTNRSDHNLFISTQEPNLFDLEKAQQNGLDTNSIFKRLNAHFNANALAFNINTTDQIQQIKRLPEINYDFFNQKRGGMTVPGPFASLDFNTILLTESLKSQ